MTLCVICYVMLCVICYVMCYMLCRNLITDLMYYMQNLLHELMRCMLCYVFYVIQKFN